MVGFCSFVDLWQKEKKSNYACFFGFCFSLHRLIHQSWNEGECAPLPLPFSKLEEKQKSSLLTLVNPKASSWALTCWPNRKSCNRSPDDVFHLKDWMANLLINKHKLWFLFVCFHTDLTLTLINIITLHWLRHHLIRRSLLPHIYGEIARVVCWVTVMRQRFSGDISIHVKRARWWCWLFYTDWRK